MLKGEVDREKKKKIGFENISVKGELIYREKFLMDKKINRIV